MKYETSIRESRIITHYVEDSDQPLLEAIELEQLAELAQQSAYNFRCGSQFFQVDRSKTDEQVQWQDIWMKGVNIGVALPGHFPAEFSMDFEQYLDWFRMIGDMNANTIRTYTILPPEFYQALAYYNLHNFNRPLYLIQGIWADIPEDENYFNEQYSRQFQQEIKDAIDVVHGHAVLKTRRGKAAGTYVADVSRHVAGFLLGREWEPEAVFKTIENQDITEYRGRFITLPFGNSMEVWLARMMDFAARYETQTYQQQRPLSVVNWLPLDPMYHNSEFKESARIREYDNDIASVDFERFHNTALFEPGIFAAYHAYPYYPDFVYLQKDYQQVRNRHGEKDTYLAYLQDLRKHTKGIPLLIAEYGLPSSRGNSHFCPGGFHQGGHSEAEQASRSLTLTEDIYDAGCAGAIYFEWADEWFKHNWLVMDFEQPFEDRKLWHNMENPEQNFGILALESRERVIDGKLNDWPQEASAKPLQTHSDAAYFYLAAKLRDFDFGKHNLYIAIDTYDEKKGDHKLPFIEKQFPIGFEFLCVFKSREDARLLVDDPYSVFTDIYNDHVPVYASSENSNGLFLDQFMLVNRGRETLLGELQDSILRNRGLLIHGNSSDAQTSNADFYWNQEQQIIELRLNWALLNVSDPAKKMVLDDKPNTAEIEAVETDGFNMILLVTDKQDQLIATYPTAGHHFYTWDNWNEPEYTSRLKPIFRSLKDFFESSVPARPAARNEQVKEEYFEITRFLNGRDAAISLAFQNASFSQFEQVLPLLKRYDLKATFGLVPSIVEELSGLSDFTEGTAVKRLGMTEFRSLKSNGHSVALQIGNQKSNWNFDIADLKSSMDIQTIWDARESERQIVGSELWSRSTEVGRRDRGQAPFSFSVLDNRLTQPQLDSLLKANSQQWLIASYAHIFKEGIQHKKIKSDQDFISYERFRRQLRLMRNSGAWIAPESFVWQYLKQRESAKIETHTFGQIVSLRISHQLDAALYKQALTVRYHTDAKLLRISGSAADGIYNNRTGSIMFNVFANTDVKIEKLDGEDLE